MGGLQECVAPILLLGHLRATVENVFRQGQTTLEEKRICDFERLDKATYRTTQGRKRAAPEQSSLNVMSSGHDERSSFLGNGVGMPHHIVVDQKLINTTRSIKRHSRPILTLFVCLQTCSLRNNSAQSKILNFSITQPHHHGKSRRGNERAGRWSA